MKILTSVIVCASLACSFKLLAWENHALLADVSLSQMDEILKLDPIKAETLEDFLLATEPYLQDLLKTQEAWAEKNLDNYPRLPKGLIFHTGDKATLRNRFLAALRINPQAKFALYFQNFSRKKSNLNNMNISRITILKNPMFDMENNFVELKSGEMIHPKSVMATATDEPDFGLDIGLWEDSGTPFGKSYGFGKQPFGNPNLEYSSQAPFHMGFFHEAKILNLFARNRMRSLVEYRIHQFYTLSRFAFEHKHDYWGWRFAGLGAHYIQDLTQPYHTTLMPGEGSLRLLTIGILDALGFSAPKQDLVERASQEHIAIERFVLCNIKSKTKNGRQSKSLLNTLAKDEKHQFIYDQQYIKNNLAAESNQKAQEIAGEIKFIVSAFQPGSEICPKKYSAANSPTLMKLLENFGNHTRSWVRAVSKT